MRALTAIAFLTLGHAAAVRPVQPQAAETLRPLGIPAGEWKGHVRYEGMSPPRVFHWTTAVQYRMGGELLSIEGQGGAAADTSRITRRVFATVWRDPTTGLFRGSFQWSSEGGVGTAAASAQREGDTVVLVVKQTDELWWRYTIHLEEHPRWVELGEASRDGGTTWAKTFDMTLIRPK